MIKKLDSMLIKGFIPPFLMSFLIALFVLVMQTLWLYIDDILGKGAGIFVILEFLVYLSISMIPLALPIGVLLAGVFLFGNLGERYELSSMKSAGISLIRIMMPILFFATLVSLFSWFCSDYLGPNSYIKFISRLNDLKKQKPTLSLQEGIFNEDFYSYVIRIGKKSSNGTDINDILIYDHSSTERNGGKNMIMAEKGRMYITAKNKFLVMDLENGEIYQDPGSQKNQKSNLPFIRNSFQHLTKVFDLGEFSLDRTSEDLFKNKERSQNSVQLRQVVDSITKQINYKIPPYFTNKKRSFDAKYNPIKPIQIDTISSHNIKNKNIQISELRLSLDRTDDKLKIRDQIIEKWVHPDSAYILELKDNYKRIIRNIDDDSKSHAEEIRSLQKKQSKFEYELLLKYSFAIICIIFIFVGAPLGAIVRKGGYGYPLLLSIFVFVSYVLLNTMCKRLSEGLTINTFLGAFIPCMVMCIPAFFLTWTALRDRNMAKDFRILLNRLRTKK